MSVLVAEYRLAVVYPMIARRGRYDVADVSPAFGQFVVNRYVVQSYVVHSFNSCNSCSLLTHPPLGNIEPVEGILQRVNDVYLVGRHGTAFHDAAQVAVAHLHGAVAEAPGDERVR